jgi:hypothetical protein
MAYTFWSNVQVAVGTFGAAQAITGISQASPAVVSRVAHGLSNGQYVVFEVQGMFQINKVLARVAGVTADTFQAEGIDSSNFNAFTSGSYRVVTFANNMSNVVDVNASGGEPEFADITTIHQNIRTRVPVVTSPLTFSMTGLFDPSDAAMQELAIATRAITERGMRFTFSNGNIMVFSAYPSAPGVPTGSAQQAVQTPITLEAQGLPTIYES